MSKNKILATLTKSNVKHGSAVQSRCTVIFRQSVFSGYHHKRLTSRAWLIPVLLTLAATLNTYGIQEKRCDSHESWRQTASQKRKTICWLHQSFSLCSLFTDKQTFYSWRTALVKTTNVLQPARDFTLVCLVKVFGPGLYTSDVSMDSSKYLMYKEYRVIIQNLLFLPQD